MSLSKLGLSVFSTRVFLILWGLVLSVIVNRTIGPENRGVLELLSTIPVLLISVSHLGIGNANLYFLGQNIYTVKKIIDNSLTVSLLISIFLLLISGIGYLFLKNNLFYGVPFHYVMVAAGVIPFLLFQKFLYYVILGKDKIILHNRLQIINAFVNSVFLFFFIFILKLDVLGILLATLIAGIFTTAICLYLAADGEGLSLRFDAGMFYESVKFGLMPFLALAVMNLIFKSDVFLIKHYLNDLELGYYGLGVSLCERIWILPESIGLVVLAKAVRVVDGVSAQTTAKICRITLWATIVCCSILFVFGEYAIYLLYGTDFVPAVVPFQILLPGIAMISVYLVLHSDLTGRGQARYTFYMFSGAFLLNILLNILLIPKIGIAGAAVSSSICYSLGSIGLAIIYSQKYSLKLGTLFFMTKEDFSSIIFPILKKYGR